MGSENCNVDDRVGAWVHCALSDEDVEDVSLQISDKSKPGDGYISDIVYVDVEAKRSSTKEACRYHLAVKMTKEKKGIIQDFISGTELFKAEICVYSKLVPAYQELLSTSALEPIDFMPKCYWSTTGDQYDVLVFDNLKKSGYSLHQRDVPMNDRHIELVLKAYGRWHALSFALRHRDPETFDMINKELETYHKKMQKEGVDEETYKPMFEKMIAERDEIFMRHTEQELLDKFKEKTKHLVPGKWHEIFPNKDECVLVHGDCWNNNFLFVYKGTDAENPSKVSLVDFQLSKLTSPVIDLSYFLYSVCSGNELINFRYYIQLYYEEFASSLKKLGNDPDEVFPFSKLTDHWKEYALYGFQIGMGVMKLCLSDDKGVGDEGSVESFDWKLVKNKDQYESRLIECTRHLIEYEL